MNYKSIKQGELLRLKTDAPGFAVAGEVVKVLEVTPDRIRVRNKTHQEALYDISIMEASKEAPLEWASTPVDLPKFNVGKERVQCNALVSDSHKYTDVTSCGVDGPTYAVVTKDGREVHRLTFHEGPLAGENAGDVKGVMIENLLAIVIDRLRTHQRSKYACAENELAFASVENALYHLQERTKEREERKVEGTHEV